MAQHANDFGITIGYNARWYALNILQIRVFPPVNGTDGVLVYIFDPTASSSGTVIDRLVGASQGAVVTPNAYGIRYGKTISQFNFSYLSTAPICELNAGPAGLWWFDFQCVFK